MDLLQPYLTWIYMVAGTLLFLALAYWLVRSLGGSVRGRKGARLGISEYYEIDKTRRLVLVRRDDSEHLILIGGGQDMVIELNIGEDLPMEQPVPRYVAPQPPSMAPHMPPMQQHPPPHMPQIQPANTPLRPPPRPAVFGERRPQLRPVEPHEE